MFPPPPLAILWNYNDHSCLSPGKPDLTGSTWIQMPWSALWQSVGPQWDRGQPHSSEQDWGAGILMFQH